MNTARSWHLVLYKGMSYVLCSLLHELELLTLVLTLKKPWSFAIILQICTKDTHTQTCDSVSVGGIPRLIGQLSATPTHAPTPFSSSLPLVSPGPDDRATLSLCGHLIRNTVVPRKRWLSLVELGGSAEHSENGISNRGLQLARNPELASLDWVQLASFSTPHSGISLSVSVHDATCS